MTGDERTRRGIVPNMTEPAALVRNTHWRTAVWSLRVGYIGLVVGIVGVIVALSGSTPWILAAGVIVWLAAAVFTVSAVFRARRDLAEPRPGLWDMRFLLVRDTIRRLPSA